MFAPQTNPASPAVFQQTVKNWFDLCLSRMLPLPLKLFPVYQLFCAAVCGCKRTLVLGSMSPLSRVGQQPQPLYHMHLEIFAALNRSTSDPVPPSPRTAGFLGESR